MQIVQVRSCCGQRDMAASAVRRLDRGPVSTNSGNNPVTVTLTLNFFTQKIIIPHQIIHSFPLLSIPPISNLVPSPTSSPRPLVSHCSLRVRRYTPHQITYELLVPVFCFIKGLSLPVLLSYLSQACSDPAIHPQEKSSDNHNFETARYLYPDLTNLITTSLYLSLNY
jgi:hypothetical protein